MIKFVVEQPTIEYVYSGAWPSIFMIMPIVVVLAIAAIVFSSFARTWLTLIISFLCSTVGVVLLVWSGFHFNEITQPPVNKDAVVSNQVSFKEWVESKYNIDLSEHQVNELLGSAGTIENMKEDYSFGETVVEYSSGDDLIQKHVSLMYKDNQWLIVEYEDDKFYELQPSGE